MGLSKSTRILILLGIDTVFFLLELVVGYAVHSLALVADSFHMLNDVLSLCVGFWAVKVANQKTSSKMYTYGWQRAETLGALVNGVFLVALCLSIFLEAIQRFVEPQEVSQPKLVLVVGCFGLASNVLGLFLFHEHGHSHGGHGHIHKEDDIGAAEEGHVHPTRDADTAMVADESGNVADVLPESTVGGWSGTATGGNKRFSKGDEDTSAAIRSSSPVSTRKDSTRHRRRTSGSRARHSSVDEIHVHPASFRNEIIAASRLEDIESAGNTGSEDENSDVEAPHPVQESTPLLSHDRRPSKGDHSNPSKPYGGPTPDTGHSNHKHRRPKDSTRSGGHSHSHGDLNMRGVFLHVMGDALGNIGVIASALFIWLTDFSWRFYSDPAISLIITIIILGSAIPLCRAASRILLQAVPVGISVDDIKDDIEDLLGVISCHHLHVWQLSDTKLVASLHIEVEFDFKGEGSARYMRLAQAVRTCLHEYGIHSSTIQPEFCLDSRPRQALLTSWGNGNPPDGKRGGQSDGSSAGDGKAVDISQASDTCLLECGDECGGGAAQCCAPAPLTTTEASTENHAKGSSQSSQ